MRRAVSMHTQSRNRRTRLAWRWPLKVAATVEQAAIVACSRLVLVMMPLVGAASTPG